MLLRTAFLFDVFCSTVVSIMLIFREVLEKKHFSNYLLTNPRPLQMTDKTTTNTLTLTKQNDSSSNVCQRRMDFWKNTIKTNYFHFFQGKLKNN